MSKLYFNLPHTAVKDNTVKVFVNVYSEGSAYGGGEEGGWYYTYGELERSVESECTCPIEEVVSMEWEEVSDDYGGRHPEYDHMKYELASSEDWHRPECPSAILVREIQASSDPKDKAEFLQSYITANGTWSPDSMEDAPEDYVGERVTGGEYVLKIQDHRGRNYPENTPRYC